MHIINDLKSYALLVVLLFKQCSSVARLKFKHPVKVRKHAVGKADQPARKRTVHCVHDDTDTEMAEC